MAPFTHVNIRNDRTPSHNGEHSVTVSFVTGRRAPAVPVERFTKQSAATGAVLWVAFEVRRRVELVTFRAPLLVVWHVHTANDPLECKHGINYTHILFRRGAHTHVTCSEYPVAESCTQTQRGSQGKTYGYAVYCSHYGTRIWCIWTRARLCNYKTITT